MDLRCSVLVDVWEELQEFGRRRRLTFRGGRNERSLLKERLDRAFDLFKASVTLKYKTN